MNRRHDRACNLLNAVAVMRDKVEAPDAYPFNIPAIRALRKIEFNEPVSFLIGENRSGKSMLLEAIAVHWGLNPESGSRISASLPTPPSHLSPKDRRRLVRSPRRLLLRSETFFDVATRIDRFQCRHANRLARRRAHHGPRVIR
jgi:predicted ATPase